MRKYAQPDKVVLLGGVVEWLMAPVLKTGEVKASVGSNPTPSVSATARDPKQWQGVSGFLLGSLADIGVDDTKREKGCPQSAGQSEVNC
jgi:hypothetical protein